MQDGIWDDGEWISGNEISEQLQYKERGAKCPNSQAKTCSANVKWSPATTVSER